jgi:hypothetical protein
VIKCTIRVPSKEECERKGFPCYNCDLRSVTNCVVFRDHMLEEYETSGKEVPKVTYEDIKKSVEELEKQKEKIERLQKEFIEKEIKNNPMFIGYYIDNVKKQLSLYGLPIYPDSSTDKNTFTFQKSNGEIIKVGLPSVTSINPSTLHYSAAPSGKIPVPSKPTELEFHVAAGKYLDKKIEDVFNLDSKGEKISLEKLLKKFGLTQKDFSPEATEKVSDKREKPELSKRVNSKKVVLRENFC